MAIMKIGRALFFAYSIVSCVLLARANVARADLGGDQTIGEPRTEPSEAAKARMIWQKAAAYCTSTAEHKDEYRTRNLCDEEEISGQRT